MPQAGLILAFRPLYRDKWRQYSILLKGRNIHDTLQLNNTCLRVMGSTPFPMGSIRFFGRAEFKRHIDSLLGVHTRYFSLSHCLCRLHRLAGTKAASTESV